MVKIAAKYFESSPASRFVQDNMRELWIDIKTAANIIGWTEKKLAAVIGGEDVDRDDERDLRDAFRKEEPKTIVEFILYQRNAIGWDNLTLSKRTGVPLDDLVDFLAYERPLTAKQAVAVLGGVYILDLPLDDKYVQLATADPRTRSAQSHTSKKAKNTPTPTPPLDEEPVKLATETPRTRLVLKKAEGGGIKTLGGFISELLEAFGKSGHSLAHDSGLDKKDVYNIIHDRELRRIGELAIKKLADGFGFKDDTEIRERFINAAAGLKRKTELSQSGIQKTSRKLELLDFPELFKTIKKMAKNPESQCERLTGMAAQRILAENEKLAEYGYAVGRNRIRRIESGESLPDDLELRLIAQSLFPDRTEILRNAAMKKRGEGKTLDDIFSTITEETTFSELSESVINALGIPKFRLATITGVDITTLQRFFRADVRTYGETVDKLQDLTALLGLNEEQARTFISVRERSSGKECGIEPKSWAEFVSERKATPDKSPEL